MANVQSVVNQINAALASISTAGIAYSQAVFTFERVLSPEEITSLSGITDTCKAYAANLYPAMIAEDDIPFVDPETGEIVEALN